MRLPVHQLRGLGLLLRDIIFRAPMDNPIFLMGCGHSGTTLLSRILGAHHAIYMVPGETNCFIDYRIHKPEWYARMVFRLCDMACKANGKLRWLEKSNGNVKHVDKIFKRYPLAKIIWLIRDGRDVVASLHKVHPIDHCINRWKELNEVMLPWQDNPQVYKLHYEDLITDYDKTMESLMAFLGMNVDPMQQHYYRNKKEMFFGGGKKEGNLFQYRNWQTNKPITDCRGRWKSLTEEEKQQINEELGDLLTQFGYELCS